MTRYCIRRTILARQRRIRHEHRSVRPPSLVQAFSILYALVLATGVVARVPSALAQPAAPDGRFALGAIYTTVATTFSIWSPDTDDVKLFLEGQPALLMMTRIPDTDEYTDVFQVEVPGNHHLKRYNFRIRARPFAIPCRFNPRILHVVRRASRDHPSIRLLGA
jgi:hypothetical protein